MQRGTKVQYMGFRATEQQRRKLEVLASATGGDLSAVLRGLIDRAELRQLPSWQAVPADSGEAVTV